MSGAFGQSRHSRTRSPIDWCCLKGLLANVSKSELKLLRVAVRRSDVIGGGPQLPLDRTIDDPTRICAYVHYRKDKTDRLQPPVFGHGIKVNQDFTENRRVFTREKSETQKRSSRKSRSRSNYRSRSPRNRSRSPRNRTSSPPERSRNRKSRGRSNSQNRRGTNQGIGRNRDKRSRKNSFIKSKSRSRTRSRSTSRRSRGRKNSARRSISKHRSRSRERRCSSERHMYKDNPRRYSRERSRQSPSPPRLPHEHEPECPLFSDTRNREYRKSVTPLRPGEYRPGHPDLAERNRSYKDRSRSRRSLSRDDLPSTSRDRSPDRFAGSSRTSRKYTSPTKRNRSPVKSDRYRRRSRSPYNSRSPTKRSHNDDRRRSRSPRYEENMHREYGYYEGWGSGPRIPAGRGGYPMQPFFPPFHPRGIIPGPIIPPGHMIVPRMPMMNPYGPYRPHLPVYNSGAVRQKVSRPSTNSSSTITSEQEKNGDSEGSRVVIREVTEQNEEKNEDSETIVATDTCTSKNEDSTKRSEEGDK